MPVLPRGESYFFDKKLYFYRLFTRGQDKEEFININILLFRVLRFRYGTLIVRNTSSREWNPSRIITSMFSL
jgi:hypothetical protein